MQLRSESFEYKRTLSWALIGLTVISALIVGFFLHGGLHGLYMDDYSDKVISYNFATGHWKPTLGSEWKIRPLGLTLINNISEAIPDHEIPVRVGIVLVHLLNVILLALLAERLSGSKFVAIVAGACFLFPIFANEAVLWFTAAIYNTLSLCFLLLGFHCFLSCRNLKKDAHWFVCGVASWLLMVCVYESGLFTTLLLPFLMALRSPDEIRPASKVGISALAATYIPVGVYGYFVERTSPAVTSRGGATLSIPFILSKVPTVLRNIWWLLANWGILGPLREAFKFGEHEWLSMRWGVLFLIFEGILCILTVIFPVASKETPRSWRLLGVVLVGLAWSSLAFVPILLIKNQGVELRTLYIPSAGISMAVAAFFCWFAESSTLFCWFPESSTRWAPIIKRFGLALSGIIIFLGSITMAGLVRTYELRWDLDQKQLAAVQPVVSNAPPGQPLWLLPIALDERTVSASWKRDAILDLYLVGAFETSWSAADSVRLQCGDRDVHAAVSNRWDKLHLTYMRKNEKGEINALTIQGFVVPVQNVIAFSYREGHVVLLNPLEITQSNGVVTDINLPLTARVAHTGVTTEPGRLEFEKKNGG